MAKDLFYPGSILSLHKKAAEKLISSGDGDAALLYLALLDRQDASALSWDNERLGRAKNTLISLHLIDPSQPVEKEAPQKLAPSAPPDYTREDIAQALQGDRRFEALVPEVERMLGKVLSSADLKTLYLLFDYYALPSEVIMTLVAWCVEKMEKKYGPGRKPTLTQIRREGAKWQAAGVDSLESADAYVRRQTRLGTRGATLFRMLTGETRSPVPREAEYLDKWMDLPFDDEALEMARDRTLFQKNRFVWSYANAILTSWSQQGLYHGQDIRNAETRRKQPNYPRPNSRGQDANPVSTADVDRFWAELHQSADPNKEG